MVVIAAGAFTFDARHGLATFLRTRAPSMWQLVAPRFAVNAAAAAVAYLLGTLAAWYETQPADRLAAGRRPARRDAVRGVYLAFAVAVTAFAASLTTSTVAAVGIALAILLAALPLLGTVNAIYLGADRAGRRAANLVASRQPTIWPTSCPHSASAPPRVPSPWRLRCGGCGPGKPNRSQARRLGWRAASEWGK